MDTPSTKKYTLAPSYNTDSTDDSVMYVRVAPIVVPDTRTTATIVDGSVRYTFH